MNHMVGRSKVSYMLGHFEKAMILHSALAWNGLGQCHLVV